MGAGIREPWRGLCCVPVNGMDVSHLGWFGALSLSLGWRDRGGEVGREYVVGALEVAGEHAVVGCVDEQLLVEERGEVRLGGRCTDRWRAILRGGRARGRHAVGS